MKRHQGWLLAAEVTVLGAGMTACTFWPLLDGVPSPPNPTAESIRLDHMYGACGPVLDEAQPPKVFPIDGGLLGPPDRILVYQRKDGRTAWLRIEDFGGLPVFAEVRCDEPEPGPNGVYDPPVP